MKLATWNVNSVRAREARLIGWLERHRPDVLCLQELKGAAEFFPTAAVAKVGYRAAVLGQKAYNGVAILAREKLEDVRRGLDDGVDDPQARLISARVGGVRVICVYVPNGGDVGHAKWQYKLAWLERLAAYLKRWHEPSEPLVLCGDFNIAPDDRDVANPESWRDTVLCHADVRARLAPLLVWGLRDLLRQTHPEGGIFSWWDYRNLGFPKNDGLRIDLVLATAPVTCREAVVDREERQGQQPSDHAPVVVTLV
jgi:exodeoxyribonuclease III